MHVFDKTSHNYNLKQLQKQKHCCLCPESDLFVLLLVSINSKLHYIHYTHVCHHIFSKVPFYYSLEATESLKRVLGDYYVYDPKNFALALWDNARDCNFLEDGKGILFWAE